MLQLAPLHSLAPVNHMRCSGCGGGGGGVYLQGAVALKEKLSSRVLGSPGEGSKRSVFFLQQQASTQSHSTLQRRSGATVQPAVHRVLLNRFACAPCWPADHSQQDRGVAATAIAAAVLQRPCGSTRSLLLLCHGLGFNSEYSSRIQLANTARRLEHTLPCPTTAARPGWEAGVLT